MQSTNEPVDIILVGGGIMSATLGILLHELMPGASIKVFERLDKVAEESSDAWNNAGTGHSAFCELNYTPEGTDGKIDIQKAIKIASQFEMSRQFWSFLVKQGVLNDPSGFINSVPHSSFVYTAEDVAFLRKRHEALLSNPLFAGMQFSESPAELKEWFPLIMEERSHTGTLAATRMSAGTDVDFGSLTVQLFTWLQQQSDTSVLCGHEVTDIDKAPGGGWIVETKNRHTGEVFETLASFVFVGAGGGALKLLNKSGIDEIDGYGGFPVGGKWLRCVNPEVIQRHHAKVYGKAAIGAPPMSVPHLDTRIMDHQKQMLFGPYAGFSTKFLKHGSYWDLPASLDFDNILPMIQVGIHNIPLTKYLINQVRMNFDEKFEELKKFYPAASMKDWELVEAGQRVQVIRKDEHGEGILEFGTELISTKDGSLAGLLGASPGASTAVSIMVQLIETCFTASLRSNSWQEKLKSMIPSYNQSLTNNPDLLKSIRAQTAEILQLGSTR